jgi:hypothetical protein
MNKKQREQILKYIYNRYTAQEVIEALIKEFPKSIKRTMEVVPKTKYINYQKYIDKLTLKNKERIEVLAHKGKYYLIYKLLLDKWFK